MLRKTGQLHYYVAHNAKAKARPNIGLRGCGYWTSEVYNKQGAANWGLTCFMVPFCGLYVIMWNGFFPELDELCGGGPTPLDYGWRQDQRKPWDFAFDIGEGYAAGKPRYRPAVGAVTEDELHGSYHGRHQHHNHPKKAGEGF